MLQRWSSTLSTAGLLVAVAAFALSLTPSLVPRSPELQGVLGGIVGAIGYALWRGCVWLWHWLGLPVPARDRPRLPRLVLAGGAVVLLVASVWQAVVWQNSIRELWDMPAISTIGPVKVVGLAVAVFAVLILLGRLFVAVLRRALMRVERYVPRRIANAVGFVVAVAPFSMLFNGVLMKGALRLLDVSARTADALVAPDLTPPERPEATGSTASLLA